MPEPATADGPATDRDDAVVVEAPTAEEALARVAETAGEHATILRADRVVRGGLAGLFGKQMVQLTAVADPGGGHAPPEQGAADPAGDGTADPAGDGAAAADDGVTAALARLRTEVDGHEATFGEALRRQLGVGPEQESTATTDTWTLGAEPLAGAATATANDAGAAAAESAPATDAARPAPPPREAPVGRPTPAWSVAALQRLRLPGGLIAAVAAAEPTTDRDWLAAMADAVAPLCRPVPEGAALVAGRGAGELAGHLGLATWADPGQPVPVHGSLAVPVPDGSTGRGLVEWARHDRWVHLVVGGGDDVEALLDCHPLAVSWADDRGLPLALELAERFGLAMAYGRGGGPGATTWAPTTPLDVAVSCRRLLPRR